MPNPHGRAPGARGMSLALLALTLVVACWRLLTLGVEDLWFDEVFSAVLASQDLGELLRRALADQTNPPGFYLALWGWAHLGSFETPWLRTLPALTSIATIPVVAWAARTVGLAQGTALLAAVLAAMSPLALAMGGEVRAYAALLLVGTVLLAIGFRVASALDTPSRAMLFFLASLNALIVSLHYFGAFAVVASVVGIVWVGRARWRVAIATALPAAVLLGGWVLAVLVHASGGTVGQNAEWIDPPGGSALVGFASQVVGSFGTAWGRWIVFGALLLAAARAAGAARGDPATVGARRARWLLATAFLPLLVVLAVQLTTGRSIWVARYLIVALPSLWLLLADAVEAAAGRYRTLVFATLAAWACLAGPLAELNRPRKTPWSLVVRALAGSTPTRLCVNEPFVGLPLEYYAIAEAVPLTVQSLGECTARREARTLLVRPGTEISVDSLQRAGAVLGPPRALGSRLPELSVWPIRTWEPR